MKNEKIKETTSKAIEQLIAALNEGRSQILTVYLALIGRFIELFPTRSLMTQTVPAEALKLTPIARIRRVLAQF